ncbi:MAG: glucohydrolase [Chloroflexi bacterium RBG_16_54_18]|nr:MAG: glucohydrolase [Chloroflexi bacterium RBG_16_54_18]
MTILKWWQTAVFYQIYPRSFADSIGDGIGDLPGITQKLDMLQDLGIDAIWLSPHYPSPLFDVGYDVSDYTAVAPEYGTMEDFTHFLDSAHQRDLRVILDLVLNHTSHEHSWFIQSRSSLTNPKRDWYVWRDDKAGGPPNNWNSTFGGPAWEYDEITGQYYYHFFFKEQPDLNWRNPEVKQAMFDVVRFWLDLGVDGFRLDAIETVYEHPDLPDHTARVTQPELYSISRNIVTPEDRAAWLLNWESMFGNQVYQPGIHQLMQELRNVVDEFDDRLLVGETEKLSFYGNGKNELHLLFNFPLMRTRRLTAEWVRANQEERLSWMPEEAWPCNTLNNHDTSRVYTQFGDGENDLAIARLSLALMLTLRGTPFLYNGEEIGMSDFHLRDISLFRDPFGVWSYNLELSLGILPQTALENAYRFTRDRCRTPYQWENSTNAGFCLPRVTPWLPVNPNYNQGANYADQINDPNSLLNFYRRMLRFRKGVPALIGGDYTSVLPDAKDYLAFMRHDHHTEQTCLVVLNFSDRSQTLHFNTPAATARVLFSSDRRPKEVDPLTALKIMPFEVYIAEV